jgi:hypothetical protein
MDETSLLNYETTWRQHRVSRSPFYCLLFRNSPQKTYPLLSGRIAMQTTSVGNATMLLGNVHLVWLVRSCSLTESHMCVFILVIIVFVE